MGLLRRRRSTPGARLLVAHGRPLGATLGCRRPPRSAAGGDPLNAGPPAPSGHGVGQGGQGGLLGLSGGAHGRGQLGQQGGDPLVVGGELGPPAVAEGPEVGGGGGRSLLSGVAPLDLGLELVGEAAGLLGAPKLGQAAAAYREAADRWRQVAEVALPADAEPFGEARRLTDRLQAAVERGDAGRPAAAGTAARLWALRDRWRPELPGGDQRAEALLPALAAALASACEAEEAALATLTGALPA